MELLGSQEAGMTLPVDVLRLLPDDYFRSLSPEVQAELRRRLARGGH